MSAPDRRQLLSIETIEPLLLMSASAIDADVLAPSPDPVLDSVSPIVIDLNDDGAIGVTGQTTAKDKSGITEIGQTVQFDIDADGTIDTIEWLDGSGDGFLVDDTKINGTHIDGSAFFGDDNGSFAHGYEKLSLRDVDGNRLLDGDELANLRLWVDNGNGQLEAGELQDLSDYNIFALSLRVNPAQGLLQSMAFTEDDQQILTEDVWFAKGDPADAVDQDEQNQPPVAVDDIAVTESGKSVFVPILNNDFDPDGQQLTIVGHTQAEFGTVAVSANGTLTYSAPVDYQGVVYFQYSISDGTQAAVATVRIDVMPRTSPDLDILPDESPVENADNSDPDLPGKGILGATDTNANQDTSALDDDDYDDDDDDDDKSDKSDASNKSDNSRAAQDAEKILKRLEKAAEKAAKDAEKALKRLEKDAEKAVQEAADALKKLEKEAKKAAKD